MADPDSDDDATFVTIGTPLEVYEEDEIPKHAVALHQQAVKDQRGRQRFHGAFTGGFSAGFFNSVGSKEGFSPATFVSSRSNKSERNVSKPEDFMDEEDLSEFGIAPRMVSTTDSVTTTKVQKRQKTSAGSLIPGDWEVLATLVQPAHLPIGIKLLRRLGWKEGQGIGPRVKKKIKRKAASKQRVYGCSLPSKGQGSEGSSSSDDDYAPDVTFAPKDVTPVSLRPKDNVHGIGYRGLDPGLALVGSSRPSDLSDQPALVGARRKGIRGQAFGVGALEADDDDIYGMDSMANYDRVLGGENERDQFHGWTAPSQRRKSRFDPAPQMVRGLLDGFKPAAATLQPKRVFAPPRIPKDYRPVHFFDLSEIQGQLNIKSTEKSHMTASTRAAALGEIGSVFDLVNKEAKDRMTAAMETTSTKRIESTAGNSESKIPGYVPEGTQEEEPRVPPTSEGRQEAASEKASSVADLEKLRATGKPLFSHGSGGFKPFSKDPPKQKRYETYLEMKKEGKLDELRSVQGNQTEWERQREWAEFERASQLYKPMSQLMASRFHRAEYDDDKEGEVSLTKVEKEQTDQEKAAACKMFGKLTRESYEWHPDRVLCKRFNVPNPYPNSVTVGLPSTKRDKFSVFDFLTVPTPAKPPPPPPDPGSLAAAAERKKKPKVGPLAVLNTPSTSQSPQREHSKSAPEEDGSKEAPLETPAEGDVTTDDKPPEREKPPMDLFKAIFDDSSDSSSSEDEENDKEEKPNVASDSDSDGEKRQERTGGSDKSEESDEDNHDRTTTTEGTTREVDETSSNSKEDDDRDRVSGLNSALPSKVQSSSKQSGAKVGIFDSLNAQIQREKMSSATVEASISGHNSAGLGDGVPVVSRSEMDDVAYGPLPPPGGVQYGPQLPSSQSVPASSACATHSKDIQKTSKGEDSISKTSKKRRKSRSRSRDRRSRSHDRKRRKESKRRSRSREREPDRPGKRRSRSKERSEKGETKKRDKHDRTGQRSRRERSVSQERKHPKKKEKKKHKKKKKKSKHKKEKHKSKKSKNTRRADSSDGEDEMSSSDDSSGDSSDEPVPSNAQILQRLMMLKRP